MTFRNGKFYNAHGDIVPLEFGNEHQIALVKRIETLREGVIFSNYNRFTCPCGTQTYRIFEDGRIIECKTCGFRYEFFLTDGIPCIRLKSK